MKKWLAFTLTALVFSALGLGTGYFLTKREFPEHAGEASRCAPSFYRHPMNPAITSPTPAKDEMGMDYLPVYPPGCPGAVEEASLGVRIDPTVVQTIGVRTAKVGRRDLSHPIRTVGRVSYAEDLLVRLHPKIEGWVEELKVSQTGTFVAKGEELLSLYSPQLVLSQQEYLLALENFKAFKDSPFDYLSTFALDLVRAARQRLELLDVPQHQIRELEASARIRKSLPIHSPVSGYVLSIGAREGQYVTPQTELYLIADLSKIWVYAEIYEFELPWVKVGDPAEIRLTAVPGQVFLGKAVYLYPYADPKTRTVKVRLEFPNPKLQLKPDLFAKVTLHTQPRRGVLAFPEEAVVRTGIKEHVFVVKAQGLFEPRQVSLGVAADGWVEVLSGLAEGEEVVVSGQFLIDSESSLQEAMRKFSRAGNGHD